MPSPFPGMDPFLEGQKWRDFHTSALYVTRRLPTIEQLHADDYFTFVSRHQKLPKVEVYGWTLRESLPCVPIPLQGSDPDAVVDLQCVLNTVYDESGYEASLDYQQAVEPALTPADARWVRQVLDAWQGART